MGSETLRVLETVDPASATSQPLRVLIADDSAPQRRLLKLILSRIGHEVDEAGTGDEALALWQWHPYDLVISDWMMPGMTGPELCESIRRESSRHFTYFILLTSKSSPLEIAKGLDAGANDFLTKPVAGDELRARVRAGERMVRLERELVAKNELLAATLDELKVVQQALDNDLVEARRLQQSLVRDTYREFNGAALALLLRPSGHVGGDLVGCYAAGKDHVGLYSIDVSGHGIASALLTARLAGFFAGQTPQTNLALTEDEAGEIRPRDPSQVAADLNTILLTEVCVEPYLTLLLADLDLRSGRFRFVQAGHPEPIRLNAQGSAESFGSGGMPVGLLDETSYDTEEILLVPGDRVIVPTDGFSEATNEAGDFLGQSGLMELVAGTQDQHGTQMLEHLVWGLADWAGTVAFADDLSAVLVEYSGQKTRQQ